MSSDEATSDTSSDEATGDTSSAEATDGPSSTEATDSAEAEPVVRDELREQVLSELSEALGDAVLETHISPGRSAWARVSREAWRDVAVTAKEKLGYEFFDFLSAIDWLPSPYGRDMNAQEDLTEALTDETSEPAPVEHGYAGGETRFQLLASLYDTSRSVGILLKTDLPDDDLSAQSWSDVYAGANWHEREVAEMFGIDFSGHPGLTHMYLPSEFEGHPLRKDYPLLARRVKPWPGIVDVEPMPASMIEADDSAAEGAEGGDA